MELVPEGQSFDFGRELFPMLLERGERLVGLPMDGYWCDIGTAAAYYRCCADAVEGRWKIRLPEKFKSGAAESEAVEEAAERYELSCACKDRAALMRVLAGELMGLGPDYSDGIRLQGGRMSLHIRPSAASCALRIGIDSADAEFAREMLNLAKDAVESLGM
jgi:hypothetical protein